MGVPGAVTVTGAAPGAAAITVPGDATGGCAKGEEAVGFAAAKLAATCLFWGLLFAVCATSQNRKSALCLSALLTGMLLIAI